MFCSNLNGSSKWRVAAATHTRTVGCECDNKMCVNNYKKICIIKLLFLYKYFHNYKKFYLKNN